MRRSQELPPRCPKPTHELLQLLTRPWTIHILWVLSLPINGRMKTPKASGNARLGLSESQIRSYASTLVRLLAGNPARHFYGKPTHNKLFSIGPPLRDRDLI
jgi:hypothetical protein